MKAQVNIAHLRLFVLWCGIMDAVLRR